MGGGGEARARTGDCEAQASSGSVGCRPFLMWSLPPPRLLRGYLDVLGSMFPNRDVLGKLCGGYSSDCLPTGEWASEALRASASCLACQLSSCQRLVRCLVSVRACMYVYLYVARRMKDSGAHQPQTASKEAGGVST